MGKNLTSEDTILEWSKHIVFYEERFKKQYENLVNIIETYFESVAINEVYPIIIVSFHKDKEQDKIYGESKIFPTLLSDISSLNTEHKENSYSFFLWEQKEDFVSDNDILSVRICNQFKNNELGTIYNTHSGNDPFKPIKCSEYFNDVDLSKYDARRADQIPDSIKKKLFDLTILDKKFPDFNRKQSYLYPVPIFAFGKLAGIVYFFFREDKSRVRQNPGPHTFKNSFRSLVRYLTREFENMIMYAQMNTYGTEPENLRENYDKIFEAIDKSMNASSQAKPNIFNNNNLNRKILFDLGYDTYYRQRKKFIETEAEELEKSRKTRIKNAIISIIVDSFAHNVGAHCLVALKWWFENRNRLLRKSIVIAGHKDELPFDGKLDGLIFGKSIRLPEEELKRLAKPSEFHVFFEGDEMAVSEKSTKKSDQALTKQEEKLVLEDDDNHVLKLSLSDLFRYKHSEWDIYNTYIQENILFASDIKEVPRAWLPIPVEGPLVKFFQYLRDKSALWSGVTRDIVFAGSSVSWMSILKGFITNTLFIGTITHSEKVNRVNVYIEILEPQKPKEKASQTNTIKISGCFAIIDLSIIQSTYDEDKNNNFTYKKSPKGQIQFKDIGLEYSDYAFLREGKDYGDIKEELNKMDKVFMPNGVIGEQAFYTLIENTLRNIKHYKDPTELERIRKNGVDLYISIQDVGLLERSRESQWTVDYYRFTSSRKLFKVGVWLHHPTELSQGNKKSIIRKYYDQLKTRIVSQNGAVKLGGSSQDKVCAAMLMNNSFDSVDEHHHSKAKRHYYPYVIPATEKWYDDRPRNAGDSVVESCVSKVYNINLIPQKNTEIPETYKIEKDKLYDSYISQYETDNIKNKGILKKYFHLWKSMECFTISNLKDQEPDFKDETLNYDLVYNENLSRMRIIAIDNEAIGSPSEKIQRQLRSKGLLRIISSDRILKDYKQQIIEEYKTKDLANHEKLSWLTNLQYAHAYNQWIGSWVDPKFNETNYIIFEERGVISPLPHATLKLIRETNDKTTTFFTKFQFTESDNSRKDFDSLDPNNDIPLVLAHGGVFNDNIKTGNIYPIRVRNHGELIRYFFKSNSVSFDSGKKIFPESTQTKDENREAFLPKDYESLPKLIETITTNIHIFDNRIFERIQTHPNKICLEKTLNIFCYPEEKEYFFEREIESLINNKANFVIVHLSFIESVLSNWPDIEKTAEDKRLKLFFEQFLHIDLSNIRKNLFFIVTSGRGRGDWFSELNNEEYHSKISFRPIEALVNAVEDGLILEDDFQIKFNLCKVLFGS